MKKDLLLPLFLCVMIIMGCGKGAKPAALPVLFRSDGVFSQWDGIFSYRVGRIEVYMLVDDSTNVFLLKADGKNILIDTGLGVRLFQKLEKLDVAADQVDTVLLTHLHGHHIGGLQKDGTTLFPNAVIYLAALEHRFFTETNVNAGAVAALAPYGDKVVTFEPAELGGTLNAIVPGIFPIANYGHTPGHTVFLVEDGDDKLIIGGDFLHEPQILDYAAANNIPIGGMHFSYPGIGTVAQNSETNVFYLYAVGSVKQIDTLFARRALSP